MNGRFDEPPVHLDFVYLAWTGVVHLVKTPTFDKRNGAHSSVAQKVIYRRKTWLPEIYVIRGGVQTTIRRAVNYHTSYFCLWVEYRMYRKIFNKPPVSNKPPSFQKMKFISNKPPPLINPLPLKTWKLKTETFGQNSLKTLKCVSITNDSNSKNGK